MLRWHSHQNRDPADNTIIDGLKTVEKNVTSYSSTNFGPTFTSAQKIKKVDLQQKEKQFQKMKRRKLQNRF